MNGSWVECGYRVVDFEVELEDEKRERILALRTWEGEVRVASRIALGEDKYECTKAYCSFHAEPKSIGLTYLDRKMKDKEII